MGFLLLDVVHGSDGSLGIIFVRVADESKSTAPTSVAIFDHNLIITGSVSKLEAESTQMSLLQLDLAKEKTVFTYSFVNNAKLLELLSQGSLLGMPGKAAA